MPSGGRPYRELELNEPPRRDPGPELFQHLVTASNELYLHELLCVELGRPLPESLRRAHRAVRAELRRLEAESRGPR